MFNPYTGRPRHPSDIAGDPEGLLIVEPGAPLRSAEIQAAPPSWYKAEDRAFHEWWYGHMRDDMMQPPLDGIRHATARYIWDAAIESVRNNNKAA